jgi:cell division protein FtsA
MGVVLADIGGGTTDIAVFLDGSIWHTAILPVGGYHVTNDIAIGLRTPFAVAEDLKIRHGHAAPSSLAPDETVDITTFGSDSFKPTARRNLADIIEARVAEIVSMIMGEVKSAGFNGFLAAGMVLSGGTASLPGVDWLASEITGLPVRIAKPKSIHGLVDAIANPAYATSVGLLSWGLRHTEVEVPGVPRLRGVGEMAKRFSVWMKELLPQ